MTIHFLHLITKEQTQPHLHRKQVVRICSFLVGDGGYSAFSIFSNTCECYRKNCCTRDFGSPQNLSRLCGCVAEPCVSPMLPSPAKTKTPPMAVFLFWWEMVDSNHRRRSQQIYSLSPLATREISHIKFELQVRRKSD